MNTERNVLGNVYDKYTTRNPIARLLFQRFLKDVQELLAQVNVRTALEVGCGEGHLIRLLSEWLRVPEIWGIDLAVEVFDSGLRERSDVLLSSQSVYELGFPSCSFDIVVGAEVLEHLTQPEAALREISRVSNRYVLLSVPREPVWRAMNLARFAYWSDWGNTPGHIKHWSSNRFLDLVGDQLEVLEVRRPLPWTVVLAVKDKLCS